MRRLLFLFLLVPATILAGPTNSILFVTQIPVPEDFTTIGSVFGNQQSTLDSCGRGGDLYIRYPDGSLKNLTRGGLRPDRHADHERHCGAGAVRALER